MNNYCLGLQKQFFVSVWRLQPVNNCLKFTNTSLKGSLHQLQRNRFVSPVWKHFTWSAQIRNSCRFHGCCRTAKAPSRLPWISLTQWLRQASPLETHADLTDVITITVWKFSLYHCVYLHASQFWGSETAIETNRLRFSAGFTQAG
jgi:hypothetical protein